MISDETFAMAEFEGLERLQHSVASWLYQNNGIVNNVMTISEIDQVNGLCGKHLFDKTTIDYPNSIVEYLVCKKCFHGYAVIYPVSKVIKQ